MLGKRPRDADGAVRIALQAVVLIALALPAMPAPAGAAGFTVPRSFPAGDGPAGIAVGDFNGDTDPDLAIPNQFANTVAVLTGGAGGSFGAPTQYTVPTRPVSVATADFNGDGDLDLAVTSSTNPTGYVSVLLGGDGASFGTATVNPAGGDPNAIGVGHFDADGDPDLAVSEGNDAALVLHGGTGGSFGAPDAYPVADHPRGIAVADFNADLDPDIALPNAGSNDVSVLLGGTAGTFGSVTNFTTGESWANAIGTGDFNGDNDPDLAVGHHFPGRVTVLLGAAQGTFATPATIHAGAGNYNGVAVGDLNADGDPDLVVSGGDGVVELAGQAGASFAGGIVHPAGGSTDAVAIADVNADGDPDVLAANGNGDMVSVILNTAHRPAAPTLSGTDPASPANANAPRVIGQAPAGSIVRVYATADCAGSPVATGTAAELASPGIAVAVGDDTTTTFRATATNAADVPSECSSSSTTFVEFSNPPVARISASPNPVLTGAPVTLDASASTGFGIRRYEWDLNGDGVFEVDGGVVPTTTLTYPAAAEINAGVRVTNDLGASVAHTAVSIRRTPPPGPLGASINGGAQFTNKPQVSVSTVWPPFTRTLLLSNDGGFASPGVFPVAPQTAWTLETSGPERLPKTVYVRFEDSSQTFTDDIILDETAPQVVSAKSTGGGASASAVAAARRAYRVRVTARDRTSGVRGLQVTSNKRKPGRLRTVKRATRLRTSVRFRTSSKRIYVRVRDAAGNYSRWRTAKRSRRPRPAR